MTLKRLIFVIFWCQGILVKSDEVLIEKEEHLDIHNENGRVYLEFTEVIENLNLEVNDITNTAKDVKLFLDSLLESVVDGQHTVKIPEQINPAQSSISIEDALRKIEDIVTMERIIVQTFLEKVENLISDMNNETRAYARLLEMKTTVQTITDEYTQIMVQVTEQKRSFAINQLYEYLYIDDEGSENSAHRNQESQQGPMDDDDSISKMMERIPYGNDAHHEVDEITDEFLIHQKLTADEIPKIPLKKASYSIHIPTFAYISIALVIVAFTLIAVGLCVYTSRRRKQVGSSPPSLAEETKKEPISIVTIPVDCHKPVQPVNAPTSPKDLPCYLDVICDKM